MVMILVKLVNLFQLMVMMELLEWTKTNNLKFSNLNFSERFINEIVLSSEFFRPISLLPSRQFIQFRIIYPNPIKPFKLSLSPKFHFRADRMAIITPLLFAFNNRKHISASVTASLLLNILISTIFLIVRKTPGICEYMPYHEVRSFTRWKIGS